MLTMLVLVLLCPYLTYQGICIVYNLLSLNISSIDIRYSVHVCSVAGGPPRQVRRVRGGDAGGAERDGRHAVRSASRQLGKLQQGRGLLQGIH